MIETQFTTEFRDLVFHFSKRSKVIAVGQHVPSVLEGRE